MNNRFPVSELQDCLVFREAQGLQEKRLFSIQIYLLLLFFIF
jgi:hypothetical protein